MNAEALKNVFWLVLVGLGFLWLMRRGGCDGGIAHGHGPHSASPGTEHRHHHSESGKPVDPVCGMEVDPATASGTRLVDGRTFFLCSPECVKAFDRDPASYAHASKGESQHGRHGCC
jgi:YHS domain-containing protein